MTQAFFTSPLSEALAAASRQDDGTLPEQAPSPPGLSLGIDIGGTFTDIVLHDHASATSFTFKELTTPDEPTRAVITGLRRLVAREGLRVGDVGRIVHATTLFTNALIERKGSPTGLITTRGFRDVLEIGTERKFELYDLFIEMPRPLVPRPLRLEVTERTGPDGRVIRPLDRSELLDCGRRLVAAGVKSVAVVFLHAYANSAHEREARNLLLDRFPSLHVSISSDVSPQIREYERSSTTVANAYIRPIAESYLEELGQQLGATGMKAELFLMLSNGGLTNAREAKRAPIEMLESGPAAGALSAAFYGQRSGIDSVLAFDMGGTTAKLSVVDAGQPHIAYRFEAARERRFIEGSGLPITISTIELIEIGAGGGSIAHLDDLGLLKVGPQSAGSVPGPACYGRGGAAATVTDANLALGYLDADFFAGGTMKLRVEAGEAALRALGDLAGLDPVRIAWGIHDIVNENMASAARVHVAERGRDSHSYALLTTGGGGPLHGCEVARKLGIATVICPPSAGVASAVGLLIAPARVDRVATVTVRLDAVDWTALEARYGALEADATRVIRDTGIAPEAVRLARLADVRYVGQGFELVVELPAGPYDPTTYEALLTRFEAAYRSVFSRTPIGAAVEIVSIRVSATAPASMERMPAHGAAESARHAPKRHRRVYSGLQGTFLDTPVYDRRALGAGVELHGPVVIEEPESTLLVPADGIARVELSGNIVVRLFQTPSNWNAQAIATSSLKETEPYGEVCR